MASQRVTTVGLEELEEQSRLGQKTADDFVGGVGTSRLPAAPTRVAIERAEEFGDQVVGE